MSGHRSHWPRSKMSCISTAALVAVLSIPASSMSPRLGLGTPAAASTIPECSSSDLQVMFIPESPGRGTRGAVFLQNTSSHDCSLSGQPYIRILNRAGTELNHSESRYRWVPPLPRPHSPILLTSSSSSAIVEWSWCGFATSYKRIEIKFEGWKRPVDISSTSATPNYYSAPTCKKDRGSRLAVDYVRGLGPKGIAGLRPNVRVVPSGDLRNGEKVTVSVSGFWPEAKFWLSECAHAAYVRGPLGCGTQLAAQPFGETGVTGNGTYVFAVTLRAATKPFPSGKTVACTTSCVLMATSPSEETAYAPLDFAHSSR